MLKLLVDEFLAEKIHLRYILVLMSLTTLSLIMMNKKGAIITKEYWKLSVSFQPGKIILFIKKGIEMVFDVKSSIKFYYKKS